MSSDKSGFLDELKRRHVWRVAAAYAVGGWLLVQVATQVFPFFAIPNWTVRLVVTLIVIGFPVAVTGAWVYELTPAGLRRTPPADSPDARSAHEHRTVGQKLNAVILTILVFAVALMGWRLYADRHPVAAPQTAKAAVARGSAAESRPGSKPIVVGASIPAQAIPTLAITDKSVAVLPFTS